MVDLTYPIRTRYFTLQGLSKRAMINICNERNYIYDSNVSKVQLNHLILKREYPNEFDEFINFCDVDKEELKNRMKELEEMKTLQLKNILKNYRLTQNGYKSYLVDRIIKYEFYNKIITNEEQKNLMLYKINENLKYIPEINYMDNNYDNDYDIDGLYRPVEFYNVDEYVKHMENIRIVNNTTLILEHLEAIPQNYINYICYHLSQAGWIFDDYDTVITNTVNEKYSEKEENNDIINNIPSFTFKKNVTTTKNNPARRISISGGVGINGLPPFQVGRYPVAPGSRASRGAGRYPTPKPHDTCPATSALRTLARLASAAASLSESDAMPALTVAKLVAAGTLRRLPWGSEEDEALRTTHNNFTARAETRPLSLSSVGRREASDCAAH